MTRVLFSLELPLGYESIKTIEAIQELIFPGSHDDVTKDYLRLAERYYGTDTWKIISILGRHHRGPYQYHNGAVVTWSSSLLNHQNST